MLGTPGLRTGPGKTSPLDSFETLWSFTRGCKEPRLYFARVCAHVTALKSMGQLTGTAWCSDQPAGPPQSRPSPLHRLLLQPLLLGTAAYWGGDGHQPSQAPRKVGPTQKCVSSPSLVPNRSPITTEPRRSLSSPLSRPASSPISHGNSSYQLTLGRRGLRSCSLTKVTGHQQAMQRYPVWRVPHKGHPFRLWTK